MDIELDMDLVRFNVIVSATEQDLGIGSGTEIPWYIPTDMKFFKNATTMILPKSTATETTPSHFQNCVIMGRKTYESIPSKYRPLPGRVNIVITTNTNLRNDLNIPDSVLLANSLKQALCISHRLSNGTNGSNGSNTTQTFVIGGASVYDEAIALPGCQWVYLTRIFSPPIQCSTKLSKETFARLFSQDAEYTCRDQSPRFCENGITFDMVAMARSSVSAPNPIPLPVST